MSHTTNLLDRYKLTLAIETDMAAAKSLGLTRAAISGWRTETRHADADAIERMCKGTGEPLAKWLPLIESERARSPAIAKVWLRLAQAAAVIMLAVSFGRLNVGTTQAQTAAHNPVNLYIM